MIIDNLFENNKKPLNEVDPHNFDSDEDYYAAANAPAKPRYRGQQSPGVNPDDEAYFREIFRKKREAAKKAAQDKERGVSDDSLNELSFGKTKRFINRVGQASRAFADNFKASGADRTLRANAASSFEVPDESGMINPATGKGWTKSELAQSRAARMSSQGATATPSAAPGAAPVSTAQGWNDPKSANYVGRREVARRQATPPAAPATAKPNYAGPSGYSSVKMNAPTSPSLAAPKAPAAPAVAAVPKVTAGGPTAAEKAALDKRIAAAAAAQPVSETIRQVMKMLEAVKTKQDAQFIKNYIDTQFGSNLTETAKAQRNKLIEHVTKVTAVRRRQFAQAN